MVEDVLRWTGDDASLSHLILYCLGKYCSRWSYKRDDTTWTVLISEIILAGADPHSSSDMLGRKAINPLSVLLLGIVSGYTSSAFFDRYVNTFDPLGATKKRLVRSLEVLSASGIDLQGFGPEGGSLQMDHYDITIRHRPWNQSLRLKSVLCAAKPEDWRLEWEFEFSREDLVGDFWHLVETPVLNVPGAWPDSDSDPDSDYRRRPLNDWTEPEDDSDEDDEDDDW